MTNTTPIPADPNSLNYQMLKEFLETVNASEDNFANFKAAGHLPLTIEKEYTDNGLPVYSMAWWTTQAGEYMCAPAMRIKVDAAAGTVEPLTFDNDLTGACLEEDEDGHLSKYLLQWLTEIKYCGYTAK